MIELTEQQAQALEHEEQIPPRVVNPLTRETFVLLRADEYDRLATEEYDDSPWTPEEMEILAWQAGTMLDLEHPLGVPVRCSSVLSSSRRVACH